MRLVVLDEEVREEFARDRHPLDHRTLDSIAEARYDRAGLDPAAPHVGHLIGALLGPKALTFGRRPVSGPAALHRVGGEYRIAVSAALPRHDALFFASHELAHWVLRDEGLDDEDEAAADYLGAAFLAPRRAFLLALGDGLTIADLAARFGLTETGAALRIGETTGRPLVVVAPASVRARGSESWVWPPEPTLRRWARRGHPGLARARLGDDPRRVVLEGGDESYLPESAQISR